MTTSAARNSFHEVMKAKSATVTIAGRITGRHAPGKHLPGAGPVDHGRLLELARDASKALRMT